MKALRAFSFGAYAGVHGAPISESMVTPIACASGAYGAVNNLPFGTLGRRLQPANSEPIQESMEPPCRGLWSRQ